MKRCVAYVRVSTPQQSLNSSFVRQIEACQECANRHGLFISAVFGDTCSGDSMMPRRQMAYLTSVTLGCPIVCESVDRWTRKSVEEDELGSANVLYAHTEAQDAIKKIIEESTYRLRCEMRNHGVRIG